MGASQSTKIPESPEYRNDIKSTPCMNNQNEEDISKCIKNKSNLDKFVLFLLPGTNGNYFATRYNKYPLNKFYTDKYNSNSLNPFNINIWAGDQINKVYSFNNNLDIIEIFKFISTDSIFNVFLLDNRTISFGVLNTINYNIEFKHSIEIKDNDRDMRSWNTSDYDSKLIYKGEGGMINTGHTNYPLVHEETNKLSPRNYHFYGVDYEKAYEEYQKMFNPKFQDIVENIPKNTEVGPKRQLRSSPKRERHKPY
jgi:hypothetical protein